MAQPSCHGPARRRGLLRIDNDGLSAGDDRDGALRTNERSGTLGASEPGGGGGKLGGGSPEPQRIDSISCLLHRSSAAKSARRAAVRSTVSPGGVKTTSPAGRAANARRCSLDGSMTATGTSPDSASRRCTNGSAAKAGPMTTIKSGSTRSRAAGCAQGECTRTSAPCSRSLRESSTDACPGRATSSTVGSNGSVRPAPPSQGAFADIVRS
jgi:hypothetical protein